MPEHLKRRCSPNVSVASLSTEDSPAHASWSSRNTSNASEFGSAVGSSNRSMRPITPMPNLHFRVRYSHYENASVYLALANLLILPNGPVCKQSPYQIFSSQHTSSADQNLTQRMSYGMRCKYPCYIFALLYLGQIRKKHAHKLTFTTSTFQRLVTAAIVVATKFYDDLYYSNEHYAKELGYPLETLNNLEISFLTLMDFKLRVDLSDYKAAHRAFDSVRGQCAAWEKKTSTPRAGLDTSGKRPDASLTLGVQSGAISLARLDASVAHELKVFMISRESSQGVRYDSEEEHLLKADLHIRARTLHKLQQQSTAPQQAPN